MKGMNETEAMALRDQIKRDYPDVRVDIHWVKEPFSAPVYVLWVWETAEEPATMLISQVAYEQWIYDRKASYKP